MKFAVKICIGLLKFIYFFMKLFPTKNKVTFISREGNKASLDFNMVIDELEKDNVKIVVLTKRMEEKDRLFKKIKYCFHILKQMKHIATSKVVVLDTYCIPISILKHKKNLKVIQMWHALGSLKKFGYSVKDKKEGSRSEIIDLFKMHKNYDIIFTSSNACLDNFAEAFGYTKENMLVMPLPRTDLLSNEKYQKIKKEDIIRNYPRLKNKKNILYAPTFRKNNETIEALQKLIDSINYENYNLIIKLHPLSKLEITDKRVIIDKKYSTLEMFFVSDYIITDYSAIIYEASFLNKPLFFYTYDMNKYLKGRDFYLDYQKEMPGLISNDPKVIIKAIEEESYDKRVSKIFADKYIEYNGNSTKEIKNLITKYMNNIK